jgi:hypothetical protein
MKRLLVLLLCLLLTACFSTVVSAHSGGTDSKGGHTNHSTGEYHYHHGYPAHSHRGGECPYEADDNDADEDEDNGDAAGGWMIFLLCVAAFGFYGVCEFDEKWKNLMYFVMDAGICICFIVSINWVPAFGIIVGVVAAVAVINHIAWYSNRK